MVASNFFLPGLPLVNDGILIYLGFTVDLHKVYQL